MKAVIAQLGAVDGPVHGGGMAGDEIGQIQQTIASIAERIDGSQPRPELRFRGLRPGDRWCLCAARWLEACDAGHAPRVRLKATHRRALEIIELARLRPFAIDDTPTTIDPGHVQVEIDLAVVGYDRADGARTIWIDDVAIGTERIGCPSP